MFGKGNVLQIDTRIYVLFVHNLRYIYIYLYNLLEVKKMWKIRNYFHFCGHNQNSIKIVNWKCQNKMEIKTNKNERCFHN